MAQSTPPNGGTCYYGNVNTALSDFETGMSLLTGSSGHIQSLYSAANYILKYDWMDDDRWIIKSAWSTTNKSWGFSIYETNGDVFAVLLTGGDTVSAPIYTGYSNGSYWSYGTPAGTQAGADNIVICKIKTTDICGENSQWSYIVLDGIGSPPCIYPDNLGSASSVDRIGSQVGSNHKFVVLGPIFGNQSSGISTNARFVYGDMATALGAGSYTIGGYKYQIVRGGSQFTQRIALRCT